MVGRTIGKDAASRRSLGERTSDVAQFRARLAQYVIIVWTSLHSMVGILPDRYDDLVSCKLALAQKSFNSFTWGQCQPLGVVPKLQHKYGAKHKS
jgi:hypothetical protein